MYLKSLFDNFKWGLNFDITIIDLFQMLILTGIIFYLCKTFYRTRAWVLIKGLLIIGAAYLVVYITHMTVIQSIMEGLFSVLMVSIVIMFQPDLQKLVESVGKRSVTSTINSIIKRPQTIDNWLKDKAIYDIVSACEDMSKVKTGALIVIERGIPLKEYIDSGISIKADISSQLLLNIFEKNTPLHDGAVIMRKDRIEAATCYLPLTNSEKVSKHLGTRHRAAIGISEKSDAIVLVVSEETGAMSICVDGQILHNIDRTKLSEELHKYCEKNDEKIIKKKSHTTPMSIKIISPILAVLTCMFILNINDPVVTRRIENVPVVIMNDEALTSKNQAFTIESGDEITVTLKGHRSVVDSMKIEDIIATADIEELSIVNAVPINLSTTEEFESKIEVSSNTKVMKIALENLSQVELPIEIIKEGTSYNNLIVLEVEGNKTLPVMASESIAKTLSKAVVVVDVSGKTSDFTSTKEAVIYDKNGNVVPSARLIMNNVVSINGTALPIKTVPLTIELAEMDITSNVNYTYELNSFQMDVSNVQIASDTETLERIKSIDLVIPLEDGLETITTMVFKLENYLPEGVYLGPNQEEDVSVNVNVTKYQTVKLSMNKDCVTFTDDTDRFDSKVIKTPSYIEVIVDTSKISPDVITLTLLNPTVEIKPFIGEYTTKANIAEIDGVILNSDISITYRNTAKEVS